MASIRESAFEKESVRHAEKLGVYCRKSTGRKGVPDREFLYRGVWLKVEFKKLNEKPDAMQRDEIDLITGYGGYATWVDKFADFKVLIHILISVGDGSCYSESLSRFTQKQNYWTK